MKISDYQISSYQENRQTQALQTFLRPVSALAALWRHAVLSADFYSWLFTDPQVPPLALVKGLSRGRRT